MTWLFLQVFLYCLVSFLLGGVLTWFFLVRPRDRRDAAPGETATATTQAPEPATETGPGGVPTGSGPGAVSDPGGVSTGSEADPGGVPTVSGPGAVADPGAVPSVPEPGTVADPVPAESTATAEVVAVPDAAPPPDSDMVAGVAGSTPPSAERPAVVAPVVEPSPVEERTGDVLPAPVAGPPDDAVLVAAPVARVAATGTPSEATSAATATAFAEAGPYGVGSAQALPDGSAPSDHYTIKGNAHSMLYHTRRSPYFGRTKADVWFRSEEDAERGGFTAWNRRRAR